MKQTILRLLREPLMHFLAIGALMFAVYEVRNGGVEQVSPDVIVIGPEKIAQIKAGFTSVWNRPPDASELDALIEEDIREEVYYREAIELGLDRGDALVRRRLRLKMEFLIDSVANTVDPVDGELEAFFAANQEDYQLEARLAFEQVFLGGAPDPDGVAGLLKTLRSDPEIDLYTVGARTQLPAQLGLATKDAVTGVFGTGFFERLADVPIAVWTGPIKSTFGLHLVRVVDALPTRTPALSEVRKDVLRDWKTAKLNEIADRDYAERRKRFTVEINRPEETAEASE